jgi:hypothetical protein
MVLRIVFKLPSVKPIEILGLSDQIAFKKNIKDLVYCWRIDLFEDEVFQLRTCIFSYTNTNEEIIALLE